MRFLTIAVLVGVCWLAVSTVLGMFIGRHLRRQQPRRTPLDLGLIRDDEHRSNNFTGFMESWMDANADHQGPRNPPPTL